MSNLDDIMEERMAQLVFMEHRAFCYRDFSEMMAHKTYRNKISAFKKADKVELDFKSSMAFHTLKGHRFGKSGASNQTGASISHNDPVFQMIKNLPMDKQCVHDIHLKFTASDAYENFPLPDFPRIKGNKAIAIPPWCQNNSITKITINKNDTITVIIGCSLEPIPLDYSGIIRLFAILARLQGFLQGLMVLVSNGSFDQQQLIPPIEKWIITRWDFGRDALQTYTGKKYEITVESGRDVFARIYTKDFLNNRKLRLERIESPNKTVADAIEEKINSPI